MEVTLNLANWFRNLRSTTGASAALAGEPSAPSQPTVTQPGGTLAFEPHAAILSAELAQRLVVSTDDLAAPDPAPTLPPPTADDLPGAPDEAPADDPEEPKKPGVIRLLEAGHFKGVADVRLRLNFFDQLDHDALPELSGPKGNGKAYAKFVAEYEARRTAAAPSPGNPIEPQPVPPAVTA